MARFVVIGCSVTCGVGLYDDPDMDGKQHPDMWANLVHKNIFPDLELHNPSISGSGHLEAFELACHDLLTQNQSTPIHTMIVFWTTVPRYMLQPGLELYHTKVPLHSYEFEDIRLNDITIPKKYLKKLAEEFLSLHHPHYDILKIVTYSNLLIKLAQLTGTQIYFLSAGSWDQNYFVRLPTDNLLPSHMTPFTQRILNVDNRNDEEIIALYQKIHNEYDLAGGIDPAHWINANTPFYHGPENDKGFDGRHVGIQTHHKFYLTVKEFFDNKDRV